MRVMKFGGSSIRDPERIAAVVELVKAATGAAPPVGAVVVSALGGVTDELHAGAELAAAGREAGPVLEALKERHRQVALELAAPDEQAPLLCELDAALARLGELLRGIALVEECSKRSLDQVLSFGERCSAPLVAAALRRAGVPARAHDARSLVVSDGSSGATEVSLEATYARIRERLTAPAELPVVTGFIAATPAGVTTTLGRGGSDLTAALVGAALGAEAIELWTDVDGVMSADPRLVPDAFSLARLSYEELMELSHFGAKVVYPPSVLPARRSSIPLFIKNSLNPGFAGTLIEERPADAAPITAITGVTSINDVALLRLEGDGIVGVPGIARRLFDALAREQISVVLISQASSEHSICFALDPAAAARARRSIEAEFTHDRAVGAIDDLVVEENQSIVAIVGEGMRERPGIAGRLFRVLGRQGVNVRAIAQGSSELNISLVLDRRDERRALNAIHDSFFRSEEAELLVFVAGTGRVGSALLEQLAVQTPRLEAQLGLRLRLAGIANSRHMHLDRTGLLVELEAGEAWKERLARQGRASEPVGLGDYILETAGLRAFVDCTASDEMSGLYRRLLGARVAVVSANKKPFAGSLETLRRVLAARPPFGRGLYHEATVGAGLPVLGTLRSLLASGDRLLRLEGVFSGTLGYLLSELGRGEPFSGTLRRAHALGLTEPDPREDLRGLDVARKLLILAREAGGELELQDIDLEPMPSTDEAESAPLEELFEHLAPLDELYSRRVEAAREAGRRLCYLARLEGEQASVGLEEVEPSHPCATLAGTDNLFAFYTERYREQPLVIRGPGAGPAVTAGGVFADLLRAHAEAAGEPSPPLRPMGHE